MKKTSIGGQALIEGVMMRGPSKIAMAVRKPDHTIAKKVETLNLPSDRHKILQLPFIRGAVALFESMYIGISALMYSASFWEDDEGESGEMTTWETIGIIAFSVALSIGMFMLLPNFIVTLIQKYIDSVLLLNLIEGIIRLIIFFLYLVYVSKIEDMKRVFEYHGAEHKSIHAYESGDPLTVENVRKYPIMHKRCGTSFLFMVMMISIVVLSFFGWPNMAMRVITRVFALPIIAGISYEVNRIMGKMDNPVCNALAKPGLLIQKYATVKEPDDNQIEVAIEALKAVLPEDGEDDSW